MVYFSNIDCLSILSAVTHNHVLLAFTYALTKDTYTYVKAKNVNFIGTKKKCKNTTRSKVFVLSIMNDKLDCLNVIIVKKNNFIALYFYDFPYVPSVFTLLSISTYAFLFFRRSYSVMLVSISTEQNKQTITPAVLPSTFHICMYILQR